MVLSEQSIRDANLIQRARPDNFRAGSYDLVIRDLITPIGEVVSEFLLPPQGVIKVISAESVQLPAHIIGYVLVKTKLCNEGVLALNIGIVDPGFDGPLQSTLINFGKTNIRLRSGDVFSRISFHFLDRAESSRSITPQKYDDVRRSAISYMDRYLAPTFLDIEKTSEKAAEKAFGDFRGAVLKFLPIVAFGVALLTFGLNFGNMWLVNSYMKPQDIAKTEISTDKLEARLKELESENAALSKRLDAISGTHVTTER